MAINGNTDRKKKNNFFFFLIRKVEKKKKMQGTVETAKGMLREVKGKGKGARGLEEGRV